MLQATATPTFLTKDTPRAATQALVIAVSPLIDDRFERAVLDLAARGFDVVILAVSPIAVTRDAVGTSPVVELACRVWALVRRVALARLRSAGLTVLEWDPREPL